MMKLLQVVQQPEGRATASTYIMEMETLSYSLLHQYCANHDNI